MARSDLNVRLGLELRNFERGLKTAERSLRRTAQNLQSIGQDLTIGVTTPIIAAGGASLQAAAQFERLELALEAVVGNADEAQAQLEQLRVIAESPGLGFEQGVRAAARLQAVGLSSQEALSAIQEFGNAVARSGGGAQEFDGAILALTQIASKGKISAEEINQLNERIFEIRPALERAFGTSNSEELTKLGISAEEFIAKVTEEFSKLDRVQGGLANSFENLGISVRTALADIGQEVNEIFGVQEAIDQLITFVGDAVRVFKNLDEETKRGIVRFAALAAAVGPAIFAVGKLAAGFNTLRSLSANIAKFLVSTAARFGILAGATTTAEVAATRFNRALKFTQIGIALAAVGALVAVFLKYKNALQDSSAELESTVAATSALDQVQRQATESVAAQRLQVAQLVAVAQDETKAQDERVAAIRRLKSEYPDYFGSVSEDITKTGDLTTAKENLVASLLREARARAATQKITELETQALEIRERQTNAEARQQEILNRLRQEGFDSIQAAVQQTEQNRQLIAQQAAGTRGVNTGLLEQSQNLAAIVGEYQNVTEEIRGADLELKGLSDTQRELANLANAGAGAVTAPQRTFTRNVSGQDGEAVAQAFVLPINLAIAKLVRNSSLPRLFEDTEAAAAAFAETSQTTLQTLEEFEPTGLQKVREELEQIQAAGEATGEGPLDILSRQADALRSRIGDLAAQFGASSPQVAALQEQLKPLTQTLSGVALITEGLGPAFSDFFTTLAEGGKDAFGALIDSVKKFVVQLVAAVATAAALALLISFIIPGAGSFTGLLSQFTAGSSAGNLLSLLGVGLATGGIVPPGYPGDSFPARLTSGEAIIPLDRIDQYLPSQEGGPLTGEIRLAGNDLVVALERFQNNRSRTRGR